MILLDTNLLTRMTRASFPQYADCTRAVHRLETTGELLILVPQNLFEFWSVATRQPGPPPIGQNGLGMTCLRASQWTQYFRRRFTFIADKNDLFDRWFQLVTSFGIKGTKSYDARLVAAMQTHGIARILTFNLTHFKRFPIAVIDPASV